MTPQQSIDVLLFDSNLGSRTLISADLRKHAVKVLPVGTAADAVERFCRRRYDAVLIVAPSSGQDCWPLIRLFRSGRCGFPQTPVFVAVDEQDFELLMPRLDRSTFLLRAEIEKSLPEQLLAALVQRPRPSILVVEDESLSAQAAELALQKFFNVEVTHDGQSALSEWTAKRHDLIVLDLMLPGMSGREVLREIRSADPDQPVLILTSLDSPEHHQGLVLEGANDYMVKTPDLFDLATRCDTLLFERSLRRSVVATSQRVSSQSAVAARIHAASRSIHMGQASVAANHLAHAMATLGSPRPMDDDSAATI